MSSEKKITLKDLLSVCAPDWLTIGKRSVDVAKDGIPDEVISLTVKEITGWDDGLTVELFEGSSPCTCLPVGKERGK